MIRKQARLRKEYLYRKELEAAQAKEAKASKTEQPTQGESDAEKDTTMGEEDDEYSRAGFFDPKVVITTSRDPSARLQQFAKEMRLLLPNAQRINRGNHVMDEIVHTCKASEVTDLILLHEHRGEPDGLIVCHLPHGPTAYFTMYNVSLRHDMKEGRETMSEAYPQLIFNNFNTALGKRVMNILKYLFPVPKEDSKRVLTFSNESDYISFRHHTFNKKRGEPLTLHEVGPRFEMRPYQIKLGTADMADADTEWVLRPYHRTAHKRDQL